MRDIKYRVWCHKTKQLYNCVDKIEWLISGQVIRSSVVISEIEEHNMRNEYDGNQNFVLQQYIGMCDIHAKGIYEGDYCKVYIPCPVIFSDYNDCNSSVKIVAKVVYDENQAGFKLYWESDSKEENGKYDYIDIDTHLRIEVIGNIYQSDFEIIKKAARRDFKIDNILE